MKWITVVTSTMLRRVVVGCVATVALLATSTACGSSSTQPGGGSGASSGSSSSVATGNTIDVKNFAFTPADLTVPVGTTVTWKFEDSAQHTVKADDNSFSSAPLNNGQTFQYTFKKAGSYHYICTIHQYMMGTITVK